MMLTCDYSDSSEQSSRKFAKTCVEKKRRDRINKSLDELKDLMALTDERARYQKLEKAEILEMTVNYIRNLKRHMHNSADDYENGYKQCSEEMWKLIYSSPNIIPEQRERLANRCRQMWTNRRFANHPYQRRTTPSSSSTTGAVNEQYSQKQSSSHLKILVNHSSIINPSNPCSSLSSSSSSSLSNRSSSSLSPSSPKLWKPYM
ncbi:unnamed protein product [Rotaria socialis]|uniref:BHLH domain-containing protein n=4 Tax=Rotaria socialis TaxID=392032 RepID=A0A819WV99_9BILA|nr:unnamed protein product [Rotaria socialis]CAF3370850.1 unnamed protein product [Rotaria socialis]CAF3437057.1 unnamed protein product [Rotaria socialis]CAF3581020.1 unnamed protein product [Rotaria socialis]CAF3669840.1 unnamed protein product [Rotaria socialis]